MHKPHIEHYHHEQQEKDRPNPFIIVLIGIWVVLAALGIWKLGEILF